MARDLFRESFTKYTTVDLDYELPIWKEAANKDSLLKRITLRDLFASDLVQTVLDPPNWASGNLVLTAIRQHSLGNYSLTLINGTYILSDSIAFRMLGDNFMPNTLQENGVTKILGINSVDGKVKYTTTLFNTSVNTADDITAGSTNLFLTASQATKLGHISVTQAVDLDQMETDITANNAKPTNNLATGDLTQAAAARTYGMNNQNLTFNNGVFRVTDASTYDMFYLEHGGGDVTFGGASGVGTGGSNWTHQTNFNVASSTMWEHKDFGGNVGLRFTNWTQAGGLNHYGTIEYNGPSSLYILQQGGGAIQMGSSDTINVGYGTGTARPVTVRLIAGAGQFEISGANAGVGSTTFRDDTATTAGIEYAADYSSDFTARSLVDKAYVDANSGGNSVYTADDSLTANRTVNLNGKTLDFDQSGNFDGLKIDYTSSGLSDYAKKSFQVLSEANSGNFQITGKQGNVLLEGNNSFTKKDHSGNTDFQINSGGGGYWKGSTITLGEDAYGKCVFPSSQGGTLDFYNGANVSHKIERGTNNQTVSFHRQGFASNKTFILGASAIVGSESISLQGKTLVKGADTLSTSSALQIYDGDGTPNLLWDFRNNGDLLKGDTILKVGNSNVITGSGTHRFIFGTGNDINGTSKIWQFCVGVDNELSGSNHGAFGRLNTTTGLGTQYAFGSKNQLNGSYVFSFGGDNVNSANFTNTFGMATSATAIGAIVIGYGDSTNFNNKLVNNTANSLALGWNTTTPQHLFKSDGVNLTLPTSSSGLSSGDLWNENGVVRIGTSGGAIGGNTIYTANDSLTGDRTVNLGNTYDLIFENSGASSNFKLNNAANGYVLNNRSGGIKIRPSLAGNQPLVISNTSDNFDTFTIKANGGGEWSAYNGVKIGELTTNDYAKFTIYDLEFYKGNTIKHKIGFGENGSDVDFWLGGVSGNNSFRVGGNTLINSEAISLKGHTVIQGADTLGTSSALQIYDSDSTPSALWDFRNNGDVVLSKETTIRADYQEMLTLESSASNPSLVLNALNSGSNTNIEFARVNSKKWLIGNVASDDSFRIFNYQNLTTPISISNANKINVLAPTTTTKNLNIGNTTLIEASDVTPLTVKSSANGNMQIEVDSTSTSYNSQVKYSQGGSEKWLAGVDNAQSFRFYNYGTSSVSFKIDSSNNATLIGTLNMSNKRILNSVVNPSVQEAANSATFTINSDEQTDGVLTAMSANTTIAAPTGTPVQSQSLVFRFKDDGSARTLTWNAIFRAIGVTLPTTTTASKLLYVGCKYNSTDTKWDVVSVQEEA